MADDDKGKTVTSYQPSPAFNPRTVSIDWDFLAALSSARDDSDSIYRVAAPPDVKGSHSNAAPLSAARCFETSTKREAEAEQQFESLVRDSSGAGMALPRGDSLPTQPPLFQSLNFGDEPLPVLVVERSSASHLGIFPQPSRLSQVPIFHRAESAGGIRDSNSTNMHWTSASTPSQKKRRCQVDSCREDLTNASTYCKRRKICEACIRSLTVLDEGRMMRYCQQCSKLHDAAEFDGAKRSCRRKLRRVAERRGSQS